MTAGSAGTVTFLLTDIEGSTRMLAHAGLRYPELVATHRAIITAASERHGGTAIPTQGDACLATFPSATAAVHAAIAAQRSLATVQWGPDGPLRVRIGIHTGQAMRHAGEYFGLDLNIAARIAAAGHGGQVLVSEATQALVADDLPNAVTMVDLGLHRLKDLETPVQLFQVEAAGLQRGFPPLRTLPDRVGNLPAQTTPLVGRTREVGEVIDLVASRRLVTLTGPGGVGKTRLAVHVGAEAAHTYPDGVWLVELTGVHDARSVPARIAGPLGVAVSDASDPTALLVDVLRDRTILLILDNFEHVMDAAPVVGTILRAGAGVHVLVTSRERLHMTDEQIYPVPPLAVTAGPAEPDTAPDAVTLFVARARTHDPSFAPASDELRDIRAICTMIDGLPLAIELAAAHTRILPVRDIRERLHHGLDAVGEGPRDLPARHRTLRSTIAWSMELLRPGERRLFARLSVFRGGRTLQAVQAVCMDGLDIDPLAGLAALVDKSLLQRRISPGGDVAFEMLALLHEFAWEQFVASDDAASVRDRHAAYVADLADRADAGLLDADAPAWERVVNHELDNIREALGWAFTGGDARQGVRIAAALHLFWYWGGPHEDGPRWVGLAMDHTDLLDDRTRGRLHAALGFFSYADDALPLARRHWESSLAAFKAAGDDVRTGMTLSWIAITHAAEPGHRQQASSIADEALALARRLPGQSRLLADTLNCRGEIARLDGDDRAAQAAYEEALSIAQTMGDEIYIANLQTNLAFVAGHLGDHDRALELTRTALETAAKLGKRPTMAWCLSDLAAPELGLGRPDRAARLIGAADAALARMSLARQPTDQPEHEQTVAELTRTLGRERLDVLRADGARMSLEDAVTYALDDPQRSPRPSTVRR